MLQMNTILQIEFIQFKLQGLNFCPLIGTFPNLNFPQQALPQLAIFPFFVPFILRGNFMTLLQKETKSFK